MPWIAPAQEIKQLFRSADIRRFVEDACAPIALHSIRYEPVAIRSQARLLTDITLFNGRHYLILLAVPCELDHGGEDLSLAFPAITESLPQTVLNEIQSKTKA